MSDGTKWQLVVLGPIPTAVFPSDFLTVVSGWYDASDSSTITQSGGLVSQLDDKSGRGNHLTGSGGDRPTTGTRTINGLNVLDFNGTSNQLRKGSGVDSLGGSIYAVVQCDTVSGGTMVFFRGTSGQPIIYQSNASFLWSSSGGANSMGAVLSAGAIAQSPGREAALCWASLPKPCPASSVRAREGAGCGSVGDLTGASAQLSPSLRT